MTWLSLPPAVLRGLRRPLVPHSGFGSNGSGKVCKNHPLSAQAGYPHREASLGVEQPIPRISVRLAPLPYVFRHSTRGWPSMDIEQPMNFELVLNLKTAQA